MCMVRKESNSKSARAATAVTTREKEQNDLISHSYAYLPRDSWIHLNHWLKSKLISEASTVANYDKPKITTKIS